MASAAPINEFNRAMSASGLKDRWMREHGIDPSRAHFSESQRKAFKSYLQSQGAMFPKGVEIDSAGNMNEDEGFGKELKKWGPLAAGIAVSLFGIPGTPIAGLLSGGASGGAGFAKSAVSGIDKVVGGLSGGVIPGWGSTALRYGLQYGLPAAVGLVTTKMQTNAQREGDREQMDYYNRALEAEKEERDYRRGVDEEDRRYGRYSDSYKRDSDEEILRYARAKDEYSRLSDEEILNYSRARDEYARLSDEEKLLYQRAEDIRDKNYGYQQYGNFVETLEPFRAAGAGATDRMSQLIGGPAVPSTGSYLNLAKTARDSVREVPSVPDRPTWNYSGQRPTWNYTADRPTWNYAPGQTGVGTGPGTGQQAPVSTTQPVGGAPQVVRMRAPDGTEQDVPVDQVAHFENQGATRL